MTRISSSAGRAGLAASAGLLALLAGPVFAAPGSGHMGGHSGCGAMSRLDVTGQGEARVAPDLAVIQLGVTTQADSAASAMQQNAEAQTAVIEALKGAGLAETDIQTAGLNLNPMMVYAENTPPRITGYEATNMVSIRVAEVARLGEVLDSIVTAGANQINGISFQREDAAATEDDARRAAIQDARHKAEVLAEAAGLTLGPVIVIRDAPMMNEGPQPMMMMMAQDRAKGASTPVEPGQLSVTAQVQVQYALLGEEGQACGGHGSMHHGMPGDGDMAPDAGGEAPAEAAPEDAPASN